MPEKSKQQRNLKLSIVISLALSLGIIAIILYFTFDAQTLQYLLSSNVRYEFFLAALGINFIYWVVWALRQKLIAQTLEPELNLGLWESIKIVLANLFLANITPSMAGGEPVRIHLLKTNGMTTGKATASVFSGRLLDAIFLLVTVPFSMWIYRQNVGMQLLQTALTIAIIVFIVAVAVLVYAIKNPDKTKAVLIWLNSKVNSILKRKQDTNEIIETISREVDAFHDSMVFFVTKGKRSFFLAFLITAAFWGIGWFIPPLILMGLGQPPMLIHAIAAQILLIIIVMVPTTPGSAGVTEGGMAALYSVFIDTSFIGVFVVIYRIITYYSGLIVGAIFQQRIFKSVVSFSLDKISQDNE